ARFDRLLIVMSKLIRIDRDARRSHTMAEAAQHLRVDPSRFTAAESVEGVEADLHPLAESDGFDVVDGHAVLQRQSRDVGAQRQTAIGRQVQEINGNTAAGFVPAKIGPKYRRWIAQRGAIEFAIAYE